MKRFTTLALMLVFLAMPGVSAYVASAAPASEQQSSKKQVSGTITDNNGEAVIGASVMIPGTTIGAITDENGRYFLEVPANTKTVEVSCIGFASQTITLGAATVYNLTLAEDSQLLEETVVVGYGVQKKVNLTGSVSAVNFNDLATSSRPIVNAAQALTNATPGLQIMQSSGQPNSESFGVTVRGTGTLNTSSPLVLVDGMEQGMDMVNPQDIANISILKDAASCAIYGNRGANGVILITTKNGSSEDGKINVTLDATFSYNEPMKIIHNLSDYATYMEYFNTSCYNNGNKDTYSQASIDMWREAAKNPTAIQEGHKYPNYVAFPNTDWMDAMYAKTWMQQYNITVSGKEKRTGYNISFGYTNNPGIMVGASGYKRFQGRVNVYSDITKWLRIGARVWGNVTDQDVNSISSDNINSITTTKACPCTYPIYEGVYGSVSGPEEDQASGNPVCSFRSSNCMGSKDIRTQVYTDWYAQVKFLKHFTYNLDYYYKDLRREKKSAPYTVGTFNFRTETWNSKPSSPAELSTYMYYTRENTYKLSNTLNYNQTFGDHDVAAMIGYEEFAYDYRVSDMQKKGLIDGSVSDLDNGLQMMYTTGHGSQYSAKSLFGRVNYAYKNKLLFEANFRYDGSSRFAPESRWGFFPSFSAAWRMTQEPWMQNQKVLSDLKLRASWGKLGNNSIGNYDWQQQYASTSYGTGTGNGSEASGIAITSIANRNLTWESTAVLNFGVDFGFLNNRLTGTIDAYNKLTDGILYAPAMYGVVGNASAPKQNIAEVTNRGIEFELGWRDQIGDFSYSVKGNFSYNKNFVSKYKGKLEEGWDAEHKTYTSNIGTVSTGSSTRILEDHMINEYYMINPYKGTGKGYDVDGVNGGPVDGMIRTESDLNWAKAMQAAGYSFQPSNNISQSQLWYGEYVYADTNGDKIYGNSYDCTFQGMSGTPKWNYGLQLTAGWKGIDFSANFGGSAGFGIYYYATGRNSTSTIYGYTLHQDLVGNCYFYDPANPNDPRTNINAKYSRMIYSSTNPTSTTSSLHLEKGDFLKLRNLTIGYTLPQNITRKFFVEKLRVFASGENLFVITGFSGQDPEQRTVANYATMRQYALGVTVTF